MLSVVIPTVKYSPFLDSAIESALKHSPSGTQVVVFVNFENDLSFRASRFRLDPRVQWNGGRKRTMPLWDSLNNAAQFATEKWLFFLSDDDEILPGFLNGFDLSLSGRNLYATRLRVESAVNPSRLGKIPHEGFLSRARAVDSFFKNEFHHNLSLFVLGRQLFKEVGGFSKGYPNGYFVDVILHSALLAECESVMVAQEPCVLRRESISQGSAMFYIGRNVNNFLADVSRSMFRNPKFAKECLSRGLNQRKLFEKLLIERFVTEWLKMGNKTYGKSINDRLLLVFNFIVFWDAPFKRKKSVLQAYVHRAIKRNGPPDLVSPIWEKYLIAFNLVRLAQRRVTQLPDRAAGAIITLLWKTSKRMRGAITRVYTRQNEAWPRSGPTQAETRPNSVDYSYLRSIKGRFRNETGVIVGNGPSLRIEDLDCLKNYPSIASNKIFLAFEQTSWRPTYYTLSDRLLWPKVAPDLHRFVDEAIIPHYLDPDLTKVSTHVFRDLELQGSANHGGTSFSGDLAHGGYSRLTVSLVNLQLAYFLGFKTILLVGFDHKYRGEKSLGEITESGVSNHFHPDYRRPGEVTYAANIPGMNYGFYRAYRFIKAAGGSVINISRSTELKVFPRLDFEVALNIYPPAATG